MGYALLDAATDPATILECGVVAVLTSASAAERLLAIAGGSTRSSRATPHGACRGAALLNKNARTAMRVGRRAVSPCCAPRAPASSSPSTRRRK